MLLSRTLLHGLPPLVVLCLTACSAPAPCPDPELREQHKDDVCTMEYTPVCGCDGLTYGNACSALREGVTVVKEGECK